VQTSMPQRRDEAGGLVAGESVEQIAELAGSGVTVPAAHDHDVNARVVAVRNVSTARDVHLIGGTSDGPAGQGGRCRRHPVAVHTCHDQRHSLP